MGERMCYSNALRYNLCTYGYETDESAHDTYTT